MSKSFLLVLVAPMVGLVLLAGCGTMGGPSPSIRRPPAAELPTRPEPVFEKPAQVSSPAGSAMPAQEGVKPGAVPLTWLKPAVWEQLPGWREDDLAAAWPALLQSCAGLRANPAWMGVCQAALALPTQPDPETARNFFEQSFQPWQSLQADGSPEGLVTGYYEPLLRGSRQSGGKYRYPVYAAPGDLLVVDLAALYPELRGLRLRGRLQGNRVVPYWSREEIEAGAAPTRGRELVWVDDPVELFFLQIQGSGRVQLDNGQVMRVGYADQNGHPYRSIGKWLVDNGELTLDKASMQGIKDWAQRHPERLPALLNGNPSYVFFRELNNAADGPLGALGVPLTPERSIAVDPRAIPLGAPVWLATTRPNSSQVLNRLMLAQDTGGAIRGNVRADFFWGFGDEAGKQAGAMKQKGRMWVLLPRGYPVNGPNGGAEKAGSR
ncbi:MAG TPA: murein transglycosylase A [Thiobacillaceae bacterium]|nr:murein transglycosylase A [Thiobacillaceae bacterium]HNU64678.1 murein transglycosylase A [Thiobacillaceae bacterium]